jgi:ActR/RegA family two-component response regulator
MTVDAPDVVLLSADRLVRAPLRAQLIEEGLEVVGTDTWPSMRHHLRPGAKPRLAIVDLHDLDNPAQVLDDVRVLMKPDRVLVIVAAGSIAPADVERRGFIVVARPVSIDEIVRAVRGALGDEARYTGKG